ncbi:MAG: ATP-binding protein [Pseudomonadota bacterium]
MIIAMPLILLQLVLAWTFYDRHWDAVVWRLSLAISGDVSYLLNRIRNEPENLAKIIEDTRKYIGINIIYQPDAILPNQLIFLESIEDRLLYKALSGHIGLPFQIDSSALDKGVVIDVQTREALLTMIIPSKRLFQSTQYVFFFWMVGTSLILIFISTIFMRNQIRPILRLAHAVDGFGKGHDIDEVIPEQGAREVRQAAAAFNRMRERIHRQVRQRTDMLSGVSHDLRTPLTRIKLRLEMLEENDDVRALKQNIAIMEHMIEDYLNFARGEGSERSEEIDVALLVQEAAMEWRENGSKLDVHVEGQLNAFVKPAALRRAIDNLISNALRYGQRVWLTAGFRPPWLEIIIDDDGCGIPPDKREDAFKPFERLNVARTNTAEEHKQILTGSGLGLAITRDIARAHGGDVILESAPQGGLRAKIQIPL